MKIERWCGRACTAVARCAGPVSLVFLVAGACTAAAADRALPRLRVSDNGRFLVTAESLPFFWLGDTAWHMFGKSAREETSNQPSASLYFANRAAKGFTVIQSVMVRMPDGGSMANAYGFEPFESGDWSRPRLRSGPNDDYWDHVDWCIAEAKQHGLYLAALPLWLSGIPESHLLVREPRVAYRYGHFLGDRYGKERHIIWVLGGDAAKGRNVDNPTRLALTRALAEGIADGVNGVGSFDGEADWSTTLMTFHPPGGDHSSGEWLHAEPWLDFNMIQTTTRFSFENWRTVARDYARQPPKPSRGGLRRLAVAPQDRAAGSSHPSLGSAARGILERVLRQSRPHLRPSQFHRLDPQGRDLQVGCVHLVVRIARCAGRLPDGLSAAVDGIVARPARARARSVAIGQRRWRGKRTYCRHPRCTRALRADLLGGRQAVFSAARSSVG